MSAADVPTPRIRIIAGPHEAFTPLRIPLEHFGSVDGDTRWQPLPVGWIPRHVGRPRHGDLTVVAGDDRLPVAARSIREDFSEHVHPLLVLPALSSQIVAGSRPEPGCLRADEMLDALLAEVGDCRLELRFVALDGLHDLDDAADRLEADFDAVRRHLAGSSRHDVAAAIEHVPPEHPAYWRAALNQITRRGDDAPAVAERLVSSLTDQQRAAAAADHDGRQVLALVPARDGRRRRTVDAPTDHPSRLRRTLDLEGRRVQFVCEKLADRSGGAERVLIELANALCRRGYEVEILSHELRGKPPFYPLEFGVVHTNLSPGRGAQTVPDRLMRKARGALQRPSELVFPLDRLAWRLRYGAFARRLGEHIEATRPDVVVPFMPPAIVATALADHTHRPRVVASTHNAPEQDFENPMRWDPGALARRRRLELMERMDAIAVLLPEYQQWYSPHLRDRTVAVPNAVVPVDPERRARTERGPTILAVGRLADTKRHDLTLRAFAALAEEFPDWQLKIYGVGPLERELERLRDELGLAGRAHLPGHTSSISDEYLSAGVLCHPARFEGFPLAVTESLASGLPVIGFSDCSGVNSLVVDGENGVLIDPGDGSDPSRLARLTDALRQVMSDDELRARLGAGGPPSMEPYEPERVVDLWEQVLFPDA